ncbi:putative bifunctional diguanylate cyclase/phosphodiesterase [Castellaniella ginsengisoli]|uniref:EAL domain-containing protein n=1 Tax=Castellaniella ginsengisoli TaxID=546114 RepID=A0AB39D7Y4_9BURK
MFIELVKGVSLLLALCYLHGVNVRLWRTRPLMGQLFSGAIFGGICVIGMLTPLVLEPGIIFDARSVVLSMAGLFGGPLVAGVAAAMAAVARLSLGGEGAMVGLLVILWCSIAGLLYRRARARGWLDVDPVSLACFGLLAHVAVLALFQLLPGDAARQFAHAVAQPYLLTFTVATAVLGLLLRDMDDRLSTERALAETAARLRESELRFRSVLLNIPSVAVQGYGADGATTYWNRAAERFYGYTAKEAMGRPLPELIAPSSSGNWMRADIDRMFATGEVVAAGEARLRRKDGSSVDVFSSHALVAVPGQPPEVFRFDVDISGRKAAEEEARHLAFYDALTQLPNRRLLVDRLQDALDTDARRGLITAVFFLNLDNFKTLNDTRGHGVGDLLLREVALRLRGCMRDQDTVARLSGDSFVVVAPGLSAVTSVAAAWTRALGESILSRLREPYDLAGHEYHFSASIGVALLDCTSVSVDEALMQADMAMYRAKDAGRNTLRFFDPDMQQAVTRRAVLEAELRQGLRRGQFLLLYQPQVDSMGRVTGAEALVRWRHPEHGVVPPSEFIPMAEETGLILPLGHWIMETAMRQQARWRKDPILSRLDLSINVSPREFRQEDFVEKVLALLRDSGADPARIKLELTESLLLHSVDSAIEIMRELRAHGLGFSLDDFGTGYSSLNYLKRLPLSQIKIDQSFVSGVLRDPCDAAIARSIIALGDSLGLGVLAEGVETEAHRQFLLGHGCPAFQGYLFGRPMEQEAYEQLARADRAAG